MRPLLIALFAAAPAFAQYCPTCVETGTTPNVAANDALLPGIYHPNHNEMAWRDPSPVDQTGKDKLMVFLPGSPFQPDQYTHFAQVSARHGYHVVVLDFWNLRDIRLICQGQAAQCVGEVRHQIFDGTTPNPASWAINNHLGSAQPFDTRDSVRERLVNFVYWLSQGAGAAQWGQFLVNPKCQRSACEINWGKVVMAGHSLGAGEAAFVATQRDVARIVMLSGPVDSGASWTQQPRLHPEKYWGLGHACDHTTSEPFFPSELINWGTFTMSGPLTNIEAGQTVTVPAGGLTTCPAESATQVAAPFGATHELVSVLDNGCAPGEGPNAPPNLKFHDQVAMDCKTEPPALLAAWKYLIGVP